MVVQNEKPLGQVEEQIGKNNAAAEIDVLEEKAPAPVVPMPEEVAIVQNEREKKKAERTFFFLLLNKNTPGRESRRSGHGNVFFPN